jgi:hypothetical protein
MALGADPDYLFARLLHQACNEGLNPESIRRCLRAERTGRTGAEQPSVPDRSAPRDAAEPEGTPNRRRRRARMAGIGGSRGSGRHPGAAGLPRRRPTDEAAPGGEGPGRAPEAAGERARARRKGGRRVAGEET